ncbi:hypothetical protein B0T26DRAFT_695550 [Lasiosphaeria miniovina]|uniref:Uncharacterized protein n=1 Tax=Lasiosphaeria miniovina TaxID=1954250 RepID=A0AA40E8B9_9PEZI|nr:uncharacterized protein B0T26DRAFT_695550 [Lasiosphaeria miniovina]KAK0727731.1 hypothetical protein B0T26DRAFT_695550 [Lasiosphaeria miniovina]
MAICLLVLTTNPAALNDWLPEVCRIVCVFVASMLDSGMFSPEGCGWHVDLADVRFVRKVSGLPEASQGRRFSKRPRAEVTENMGDHGLGRTVFVVTTAWAELRSW